jgi:hypothetical protein
MVKGFTPLIGLAVVVALALAAVFGSISLANPAQAAIGQPADAQLTERVGSPQVDSFKITVVGSVQSAMVSWDDVDDASTYRVVYREVDGGWMAPEAGTSPHPVSGLTNDREYEFQVRALDNFGDTIAESNRAKATPKDAPGSRPVVVTLGSMRTVASSGMIKLVWTYAQGDPPATGFEVAVSTEDQVSDIPANAWMPVPGITDLDAGDGSPHEYTVTGLDAGTYVANVRAVNSGSADAGSTGLGVGGLVVSEGPVKPTFTAGSTSSRSNTSYKVMFQTDKVLNTLRDELVIEFHEDYILPDSISASAVAITIEGFRDAEGGGDPEDVVISPNGILVDGSEVRISLGDLDKNADSSHHDIAPMAKITVNFWQSAGIRNPTEAGSYSIIKIEMGDFEIDNEDEDIEGLTANAPDTVRRKISLSEEDGGLGDMVMVTGKGFENGVTLHFFLDKDKDGRLASGEDILCSVAQTSGENVGSCEFKVTTPTFQMGENYINAVDGDGNEVYDPDNDDSRFELKASISATPAGGSPGEIMQVRLVSFTPNKLITRVKLQGKDICGGTPPGETKTVACKHGSVNDQGSASISVTIPNWAVAGLGELRVYTSEDNDNTNVTIEGPRIVSTPQTVVANQRVSLVGTGFSPRSIIGDDDLIDDRSDSTNDISKITIGGHLIDQARINNGRDVQVDDGGNWSASVNLPLVEATTGEGDRTIRITDSKGRTGTVDVTLAERDFDITPPEGRVGTIAVVRGVGYPSKNDEGGDSFTVDVVYKVQEGTSTRVSVVPDASGRFEVQIRIPTTASIPSTNQVEVKFRLADGTEVLENKQHIVPEGVISLSETSGGPGSTITVSGEGYKAFVNVDSVSIGNFDMTPAPKPHTNGNGMMSFDILIPGLDVGIQTIEVKVGGTTSSTGFTVTESGINPGEVRPVAEAIEDLGDNLVSVWHFNNDTKAWAFYSPDLAEGNTLTHMITGETYLIRIKSTVEVILNRDTRNLTCVADNCWNQVVW